LQYLFTPLDKLADRATYFACVNFFFTFFNDLSETNYLRIRWTDFHDLFTKYRYLFVDDRSGPLFDYSRNVAMASKFGQNWQNDLHSAGWRSEAGKNMTVLSQKYSMAYICIVYKLIIVGTVTPDIARVTTAHFWTRWQKSAYPTEYFGKCWSELHQLFSIGRPMYGDY